MGQKLFKFRGLDKYAIDILINRRLYLSDWAQLNDPHEARLWVKTSDINYSMNPRSLKRIADENAPVEVVDARICALTKTWNSNLLWSHYANSHRGIAIELELPGDLNDIEIIEIQYDDTMPQFEGPVDRSTLRESLRHKSSEWHYEKEVRLVSFDPTRYFVEGLGIRSIIFGLRTDREDQELVRKLVEGQGVELWRIIHRPGSYKLGRSDV